MRHRVLQYSENPAVLVIIAMSTRRRGRLDLYRSSCGINMLQERVKAISGPKRFPSETLILRSQRDRWLNQFSMSNLEYQVVTV